MIDVEYDALRALEEDALAAAPRLVEALPHRLGEGQDPGRDLDQRGEKRPPLGLGRAEPAQQRVVVDEEVVDLVAEARRIGEGANPDGAPPGLVLLGGAAAAPRRAALARPARLPPRPRP